MKKSKFILGFVQRYCIQTITNTDVLNVYNCATELKALLRMITVAQLAFPAALVMFTKRVIDVIKSISKIHMYVIEV